MTGHLTKTAIMIVLLFMAVSLVFAQDAETVKNLYLEASGLLLYDQIEHYVEKFGSERIVFGTGYPDLPIEINTSRVLMADMNEADKKNIASGNIDRILGGIEIG